MADFDLIGKVRLQLDSASLNKIAKDLNTSLSSNASKKASGIGGIGDQFGKGAESRFRSIARSYEAFQERVRRSNALTQAQQKKFLGRGKSLFKAFEKQDPTGITVENYKDQLQLLNEAIAKQGAINKKTKLLRDLRGQAANIADPKVRGGITRSIKSLRGKSGLDFEEGLQKVSAKVKGRLAGQTELENQRVKQAAESNKSLNKDIDTQRKKELSNLQKDIESRAKLEDKQLADDIKRGEKINSMYEERAKAAVAARKKIEADQQKQRAERSNIIASDNARSNSEIAKKQKQDTDRRAREFRQNILNRDREQKRATAQASRQVDINAARRSRTRSDDPAVGFGQQSALAFKRFAAFSLAAGSLYLVVDAFRDAIKEAVSFETQLVKLAQVSNSSIAALKGTRTEIDRLSTSLGTSSKDLVESAVTIRQAGFSLQETNAALETLALTTLSPSFNNLSNTTEGLIALRSQFGTAAEDYKRQFGEINAVSKAFAVESEDIVTAIRKSGGAFKVAGGNVTELISLFTAVRATTRESADTIATGFRTIFARLQRPQIIDELKAFNIELRDTEGNFVGPLKAIEEINRALSEVGQSGDLQFSRVAEQIGGIRQISKVVPLIQQFTTAQRAANIARLGANSLEEDAAIAQTSLANRLTKTREKFLEFVRTITINEEFKTLSNTFLTFADSITTLGKAIAPVVPLLATMFGLGQIGRAGSFFEGFTSKLGGGSGVNGLGTQLALSGALGGRVRRGFGAGPTVGNARLSRGLNIGVPLGGIALGLGGIAAGNSLSSGGPLNRNSFIGGRTLSGASTGGLGGAFAGVGLAGALGVSTPLGAGISATLGVIIGGLNAFHEAIQEATDALEESKFRPAFDALTQTLSEISAGRLSPFGRRDTLNQGLQALSDRRLTSTGVEREELRGNVRQTVESLLLFQQQLLDSAKTLEQFTAAGGDDAIKFISENSVLTARELEKQRDAAFKNREREDALFKRLLSSQERLLQQSNLITAFGAALENASIKANDAAERFSFLSNTAFGQNVGVRFRGTRGFGTNTTDLGLKGNSANQISSLIGLQQFQGLASQSVGIQNIRNQLPAILSEFGTNRPIGATSQGLDTFVQDRLNQLTEGIPDKDFGIQPVIDAIVDSIESELATQGRGQNEAIQKIISAPAQFVESIFSNSELTRIDKLLAEAAGAFAERFNVFASQVGEITTNELAIRKELASSLQTAGEVFSQVAQRRDPRNFPINTLRANRLNQARALLGPNAGLAGNPQGILGSIRNTQQDIRKKELELQQAKEVDQIRNLTTEIISLQAEVLAAKDAFSLLIDNSDEIANKFAQIDQIQLGRDQRRGGADQFFFGDRNTRNQLNQAALATQVAAINPDNFFNPNIIADSLRPVIGDFLDQFSELEIIPGLKGREVKDLIIQRGAQLGGANARVADDLRDGPNALQRKLLDDAENLAKQEQDNRRKFLEDQSKNNKDLSTEIGNSLRLFITDLRTNLLQDIATSTQNRLGAVGGQRAGLTEQLSQFDAIRLLGGSNTNINNQRVLEVAKRFRGDSESGELPINEILRNITSTGVRNPKIQKLVDSLQVGGGFRGTATGGVVPVQTVRTQDLSDVLKPTFTDIANNIGLRSNDFLQAFDDRLADVTRGSGSIEKNAIPQLITRFLDEQLATARIRIAQRESGFNQGAAVLNDNEKGFLQNVLNLPLDEFNKIATAINKLGDTTLDKVTDQLNKLNAESLALTKTLEGLTGQIQAINGRGGNAAPATPNAAFNSLFTPEGLQGILQGITQGFSSFVNGSAPMTQAMNNFPRNIEMAGTHTVNVNINGAQALANMQPAMEAFIQSEIAKALTKFTLDTLPGALSYSQ